MAIEFQCPSCRATLRVPDDAVGQKGRCPTCTQKIRVPAVPAQVAAAVTRQAIEFRCPRCEAIIRSPAEAAGQKGQCPQCQGRIRVPEALARPPATRAPVAEGTYFGLNQLMTPAVANENFEVGINIDAPEPSVRQIARKKSQGAMSSIIVPVVALLIMGGVAAYLLNRAGTGLGGTLQGIQLADNELEQVPAAPGVFSEYARPLRALRTCLERDPIEIASEIMTLTMTSSGSELMVGVSAGNGMAIYSVDTRGDSDLGEWVKKNAAALHAPRDNLLREHAPAFLEAAGQRCARRDSSSEEFVQFRNSVGLAGSVGGLGYHVQAAVGGEAYPCVREAGPILYFIMPTAVKKFELVPREILESSIQFPTKYTVEVTPEPSRKKPGRRSSE